MKYNKGDLLQSIYGSRIRIIRILSFTKEHKAYLIRVLADSLVPKNTNKTYSISFEVLDKATGVSLASDKIRLLYE